MTDDRALRCWTRRRREWKEALQHADHDMYHVPEYVVLDARLYGGTPAAFWYAEDGRQLLLPLILRDVPGLGPAGRAVAVRVSRPGQQRPAGDTGFWERACAAMIETLRAARHRDRVRADASAAGRAAGRRSGGSAPWSGTARRSRWT